MIINQLNKKSPYGDVTVNKLAEKFNVNERQFRLDLGAVENDLRVPLIRRRPAKRWVCAWRLVICPVCARSKPRSLSYMASAKDNIKEFCEQQEQDIVS